jgi:hypothetical protein
MLVLPRPLTEWAPEVPLRFKNPPTAGNPACCSEWNHYGGEAIESLSTLDPLLVDGPKQGVWGGKWCFMKLLAIIIRVMWPCYRGLYVPEVQ